MKEQKQESLWESNEWSQDFKELDLTNNLIPDTLMWGRSGSEQAPSESAVQLGESIFEEIVGKENSQ